MFSGELDLSGHLSPHFYVGDIKAAQRRWKKVTVLEARNVYWTVLVTHKHVICVIQWRA